jgi:GTP-binding protein HflX
MDRLYRRRIPPDAAFTHELCVELCRVSFESGLQVGLLVNRLGGVEHVIAGTATGISIPTLQRMRTHPGRLQGLRLIHTHLDGSPLSLEDLTDLAKLRLDAVYAIEVRPDGRPGLAYGAHLLPREEDGLLWKLMEAVPAYGVDYPFDKFIASLEDEITRTQDTLVRGAHEDRAILVVVSSAPQEELQDTIREFRALAQAASVTVVDVVVQRRPRPDPRYVIGKGKVGELSLKALAYDVNLLVFDHELSPSQARSITEITDIRVIDRTQLILDIFARRARTREGKIQVELAQLRYNMSRLVGKNPFLSRLAGGIGTRGPGEAKLEVDRRRAKERMDRLEREARKIGLKRRVTRTRRSRQALPVISIIGYTNTGKSTLLNSLTRSSVFTADMPFATLDPSSKRLRFPRDFEVIVTDTVGFIRDLPSDLKAAFSATLEELEDAHLLLEVIDLTDAAIERRMEAVEEILRELGLEKRPRIRVFNKADRVGKEAALLWAGRYGGVAVSALDRSSLLPLIERMEAYFLEEPRFKGVSA